jgi:hypothetical protein
MRQTLRQSTHHPFIITPIQPLQKTQSELFRKQVDMKIQAYVEEMQIHCNTGQITGGQIQDHMIRCSYAQLQLPYRTRLHNYEKNK